MIIIGLTGGIASGKSTVAAELRRLGVPVFDADQDARDAARKGGEALRLIVQAFGSGYLAADGELDRAKLADLVFHDKQALKILEKILHASVRRNAENFLERERAAASKAVVLDVPLLLETGWQEMTDYVWLVSVSREQQIERAMKRSGMSEAEAVARIDAQMPLEEKAKLADVVLDNSGSLENTLGRARAELAKILAASA